LGTNHGRRDRGTRRREESSPCLPISMSLIYRGVTHPGRTVTAWERGVRRGASASRPGQSGVEGQSEAPAPLWILLRAPYAMEDPKRRQGRRTPKARAPGVGLLNRTCKSWVERHEVQLLRGLPNPTPAV